MRARVPGSRIRAAPLRDRPGENMCTLSGFRFPAPPPARRTDDWSFWFDRSQRA